MSLNKTVKCVAALGAAIVIDMSAPAASGPAPSRQSEPRVVEIVARKFAFEPARVEVSEGETVRLMVRSADGVHGVGIKKFKVSEEVPRGGTPVMIEFTATAVGEFEILCSEYCGKGHGEMAAKLVVTARAR